MLAARQTDLAAKCNSYALEFDEPSVRNTADSTTSMGWWRVQLLPLLAPRVSVYPHTNSIRVSQRHDSQATTKIVVLEQDYLECTLQALWEGLRPALLHAAVNVHCGLEVDTAEARNHENDLFVRSLLRTLLRSQNAFPLKEFGGVYCRDVAVLRTSRNEGFSFLLEPFQVSVVSVEPYKHPLCHRRHTTGVGYRERLKPAADKGTRQKIRGLFRIALAHNHDSLIVPDWGFDAGLGNPPQHIAELFKSTSSEPEFRGAFKTIFFSFSSLGGNNESATTNTATATSNTTTVLNTLHSFQTVFSPVTRELKEQQRKMDHHIVAMERACYG